MDAAVVTLLEEFSSVVAAVAYLWVTLVAASSRSDSSSVCVRHIDGAPE